MKVAENDKKKMEQAVQTVRTENEKGIPTLPSPSSVAEDGESTLPPLKYSMDDTDGWITVDEPILYLYAGKGPYVARWLQNIPGNIMFSDMIQQRLHGVPCFAAKRWTN